MNVDSAQLVPLFFYLDHPSQSFCNNDEEEGGCRVPLMNTTRRFEGCRGGAVNQDEEEWG